MIFFEAFLLAFPFALLGLLVFFFTNADAKRIPWQEKVWGCAMISVGVSSAFGLMMFLVDHYVPFIRGLFA